MKFISMAKENLVIPFQVLEHPNVILSKSILVRTGGSPTDRLRLQNVAKFSISPAGSPYRIAAYVPGSKVWWLLLY